MIHNLKINSKSVKRKNMSRTKSWVAQEAVNSRHPEPLTYRDICIPSSKSHVLMFSYRYLERSTEPALQRPCVIFRNIQVFSDVELNPAQSTSKGSPFIGCPQLFIQRVRNDHPHLQFSPPGPWGREAPWLQESDLTWYTDRMPEKKWIATLFAHRL